MSYSVAPIVSSEVAATASNAHGAHHGHDSRSVSSSFAMLVKALSQASGSVE